MPAGRPTQRPTDGESPILAAHGLTKGFTGTRALDRVSLEIRRQEVHALVGQNGSGKSTLIKILSGYYTPDSGRVEIRGREVKLPLSAPELRRLGVSFVHQDLGLVETMSVLDNLRVGRYETRLGRISWRRERARARALLERFGVDVDPRIPVGRLPQTVKSIVATIRALQAFEGLEEGGLLVLDEPTASLPAGEVERLFAVIRRIRETGSSVLFVTHRLDEVLAISDRVSVLRDGRLVATRETSSLDERQLIRLIVGRDLGELYPEIEHRAEEPVLALRNLRGAVVRDVSFVVHAGEILGLTGLIGAGHDEVPYLMVGASRPLAGELELDGRPLHGVSPARAKKAGLAFLPADRQHLAGIPRATVRENVTIPIVARYWRMGRLDRRRERRDVASVLQRMGVAPPDPERRLAQLSGGNQQKALVGRWLETAPRVLLLHEPTQGVDVASRQSIFSILRDTAASGTAIVYAAVEYEDLAHLCDRVLVFRRGRVVRELAGAALDEDAIVEASYQAAETPAAAAPP